MYYQGLLSLIAPSQMMICGTLTLRYLFRIVLSGAVAKGEDFITSGSVTRQGGYNTTQRTVTFPVSFKHPVFAVAGNAVIGHDEAVQTWNYTNTSFYLHEAYQEGAHWVAFGLG